MKAIVIGAGIGGLSAAVALKKAGIDCTVFEAVKEIRPVGAAISIWPNGVKCMQHLGMGDIIETGRADAFYGLQGLPARRYPDPL